MKVSKLLHLGLVSICSINCTICSTTNSTSNSVSEYLPKTKEKISPFGNFTPKTWLNTPVTLKENYVPDTKRTINDDECIIGGFKNGLTFNSPSWRDGMFGIGRHMEIKIEEIKEIYGIYACFTDYHSRQSLESGKTIDNISSKENYIDTVSASFSYSIQMEGHAEYAIAAKASINDFSASTKISQKAGAYFTYNYNYTRAQMTELNHSFSMVIDKSSAKYTDYFHSIGYGIYGKYYIIKGTYHTVKQYWWGNIHQNDSTEFYSTYKPLGLTRGYIYLDAATGEYCTKQFTFN